MLAPNVGQININHHHHRPDPNEDPPDDYYIISSAPVLNPSTPSTQTRIVKDRGAVYIYPPHPILTPTGAANITNGVADGGEIKRLFNGRRFSVMVDRDTDLKFRESEMAWIQPVVE